MRDCVNESSKIVCGHGKPTGKRPDSCTDVGLVPRGLARPELLLWLVASQRRFDRRRHDQPTVRSPVLQLIEASCILQPC